MSQNQETIDKIINLNQTARETGKAQLLFPNVTVGNDSVYVNNEPLSIMTYIRKYVLKVEE